MYDGRTALLILFGKGFLYCVRKLLENSPFAALFRLLKGLENASDNVHYV